MNVLLLSRIKQKYYHAIIFYNIWCIFCNQAKYPTLALVDTRIPFYGLLCVCVCHNFGVLSRTGPMPAAILQEEGSSQTTGSALQWLWMWKYENTGYTPEFPHGSRLKLSSVRWHTYLAFSLLPFYFSLSHYWHLPPAPLLHLLLYQGSMSLINHLHAKYLLKVCFLEL